MKYNFTMSFKTYRPLNEDGSKVMEHHFFIQNVKNNFKDEHGFTQPDNVSVVITNGTLARVDSKYKTFFPENYEPDKISKPDALEVVMTKKDLDGVIECLTKVRNQL